MLMAVGIVVPSTSLSAKAGLESWRSACGAVALRVAMGLLGEGKGFSDWSKWVVWALGR